MTEETCGEPAPGGPCTMRRGHKVDWHRHRSYRRLWWRLRDADGEQIAHGESRASFLSALTRAFDDHERVTAELERGG